jgi:predicted nucleic acid-binding protein
LFKTFSKPSLLLFLAVSPAALPSALKPLKKEFTGMAQRFYLDTAIWRDYFEDSKDGIRPLGEFAFQFLKNCEKNACTVFYSETVVHELKRDYSDEKIKQVFSSFKHFLEIVPISNEQYSEAKELAGIKTESHESDILHSILARDNKAVLVTRDFHFETLQDIVEIRAPEEVTFD